MSKPLCIAVDWGSSNLRAYLIDQGGIVLAEQLSDQGMLALSQADFEPVLSALIQPWLHHQVPVLMAGMVGSRSGWQEVPYLDCPLRLEALATQLFKLDTRLPVAAYIVPGVKGIGAAGQVDVMRGEETQLLGLWTSKPENDGAIAFCLPGTHCKWGQLDEGRLESFSTMMTGELFALLCQHSSLAKGQTESLSQFDQEWFDAGVSLVQEQGGLMHQLFTARSRTVTGELPSSGLASYLSGILIGADVLANLELCRNRHLYLIGSDTVSARYQRVLSRFAVDVSQVTAKQASVQGFVALAKAAQTKGIPL
jgi:2-dehydro-3-deoxygalactonokinase